jgi:GDP-L-fucose synthase
VWQGATVYVAGHRGLIGSALSARLRRSGARVIGWTSEQLDLRDREQTMAAVQQARPDVVVIAAARVGGILANSTFPVDFLNDNLRIQTNLFEAAHASDGERLLFLGSSCIYPSNASQPIAEEALLTGPLEPTNQAYAIAKIAGLEAVRAYRQQYGRRWIAAMPTNLYGPADNFDPVSGHVLPALIHRFHHASDHVVLWGTGTPRRELLFSDDAADALVHLLENYDGDEHVNVGTGRDISIVELARVVAAVVGFHGTIEWDPSKPDGTPRKCLDVSRLTGMGWHPRVCLEDGIAVTYRWYLDNVVPR